MQTYNDFVTNFGDPLLAGAVIVVAGIFFFKEKKTMYGVGTILAGVIVYYIMHNILTVFQTLGPLVKRIIDFLTW